MLNVVQGIAGLPASLRSQFARNDKVINFGIIESWNYGIFFKGKFK
jgi:hypothetical protein